LGYVGQRMNSVELNGSFYSLQRPQSYQKWYEQVPRDFVFSVKGGRFITHMKKLADIDVALANFFASGVLALKEKLVPVLWQLPPSLGFVPERIETFLAQLPTSTAQAAELSRHHGAQLKGRAWTRTDADRPMRHAVEVRHASFLSKAFIALCRRHNVALVFADSGGRWPYTEDLTADFVYVRLHGAEEMYASRYSDAQLERWAERIRTWAGGSEPADARHVARPHPRRPRHGRDVYVYCDNDVKVEAPFDAMRLAARVGARSAAAERGRSDAAGSRMRRSRRAVHGARRGA